MKKLIVFSIIVLLAFTALPGFSQSTDIVDTILEQEKTEVGHAAYMVLVAAGELSESASPGEAVSLLNEKGWNFSSKEADEAIRLGEYSYIIMQAFDIGGGIFYSLFPGPRYAARELVYKKFVTGGLSYLRDVSGEEALRILGRVLEWKGARS